MLFTWFFGKNLTVVIFYDLLWVFYIKPTQLPNIQKFYYRYQAPPTEAAGRSSKPNEDNTFITVSNDGFPPGESDL